MDPPLGDGLPLEPLEFSAVQWRAPRGQALTPLLVFLKASEPFTHSVEAGEVLALCVRSAEVGSPS